jgi:DNA polymerase kappa
MPGFIAKELCPHLIIVSLNFEKYRAVSQQVQDVLREYDPNFDMMSMDEAYLDLTPFLLNHPDMPRTEVVARIRSEIEQRTGLTASAGIAANRMLAKICSDIKKPNGQYELPNEREAIMEFLKTLSVRRVPGIGKVTERVLQSLSIGTCSDAFDKRVELSLLFSKCAFDFLLRTSMGIGSTTVGVDWTRKSMSVERTFRTLSNREELLQKLTELADKLAEDLAEEQVKVSHNQVSFFYCSDSGENGHTQIKIGGFYFKIKSQDCLQVYIHCSRIIGCKQTSA